MLVLAWSSSAFTYTNTDLMLCFRIFNGGQYEVEVNLGSVFNFQNAAPGSVIPITNYSAASLSAAFGTDYISLTWSAFANVNQQDGSASYPADTIWMTSPRSSSTLALRNPSWPRRVANGSLINYMESTGINAALFSSQEQVDPVMNTATTVLVTAGTQDSYSSEVGLNGNFNGNFEGDIENTTPDDTVPTPWVTRSDFYEITPHNGGPSKFLGFFEFDSDGSTTYYAADGPAPAITSISPNDGSTNGGEIVTITGSNFVSGLIVEFGGVPSTNVTFINSTTVTAETPTNSMESVDVVAANPDGQYADLGNGFLYGLPAPVLESISPANGPIAGGTLVTLTGSNLVSGLTVSFGDALVQTVNFSNTTLVTVVTPTNAAGAVDVTLINPDGQSNTLIDAFTYTNAAVATPPPPPIISSVVQSGDNLILVASGGTNANIWLLATTNLSSSPTNWTVVATNMVGANGLFTNAIPINPTLPAQFYLLSIPGSP
jgi:hypothetical protein